MNYLDFLAKLHDQLEPRTYLEIGVSGGRSLALSKSPLTIGIDPQIVPKVSEEFGLDPHVKLFALTSDEFFAKHSQESLLQGTCVDLAFIDGLHLFEQVLRDFINVERWCGPASTIVVHDVIPWNERAASRDLVPGGWAGDVWQLVPCLRRYRPDLECLLVDAGPSGLLIVRGLDLTSDVLSTNIDTIVSSAPDDGVPYREAVRSYMACVSALSPTEALDRVFTLLPASAVSPEQDPTALGSISDLENVVVDQIIADAIALERQPPFAPLEAEPPQAGEVERVMNSIVRFNGTFLTALTMQEQFDWGTARPSRPLRPDEFSFHGFDERRQEAEFDQCELHVHKGPRVATIVENAVLFPGDFLSGGVVDSDGRIVPDARVFRGRGTALTYGLADDTPPNAAQEYDGEVVYLGPDITHFGHFVLEGLARSWILAEVDPHVPVVFQSPLAFASREWRKELFLAIGITEDRVLLIQEPTRIRRLIVPEPLYELAFRAHERFADLHRAATDAIIGSSVPGSSDQPVFLSRGLLNPGRRFTAGETQLEEILRANGYLVAYPETMTLAEQVRLYNRHTDIIGARGSALHAVLFSRNRPRVHVLASPEHLYNREYFMTMALSGAPATFVNCMDVSPVGHRLINPSTAAEYLADQNLLKRSFPHRICTNSTVLRQEFEELRLYYHIHNALVERSIVPDDVLLQAELHSRDFWPLSLLLACHHVTSDVERAEGLVHQFISQVVDERNLGRLIKFRLEVQFLAPRIAALCSQELASSLARVAELNFALDLPALVRLRERRLAQGAENVI